MKKCLLVCLVPFLFSVSCVTSYKIPENYSGAKATIISSSKPVSSVKGHGFEVTKINGQYVDHSPVDTPRGGGMLLALKDKTIEVPCQPLTLTLNGGSVYAADGVAMADSMMGGNQQATGDIQFTPKPNATYIATGVVSKGCTAVWLTDQKTGKIISPKIEKK
jgi:hypothetical protein